MPRWLSFILLPLYPAAIYFSSQHFPAPLVALALLPIALSRGGLNIPGTRWIASVAAVLALLTFVSDSILPLKLYPVMVNVALLALFAASLRTPPSIIERIARMREPGLPPEVATYTRKVTILWCGFFIINGLIALITALWTSDRIWFLYNGVIVYILISLLFAGEWLVRQRVRRAPSNSAP